MRQFRQPENYSEWILAYKKSEKVKDFAKSLNKWSFSVEHTK